MPTRYRNPLFFRNALFGFCDRLHRISASSKSAGNGQRRRRCSACLHETATTDTSVRSSLEIASHRYSSLFHPAHRSLVFVCSLCHQQYAREEVIAINRFFQCMTKILLNSYRPERIRQCSQNDQSPSLYPKRQTVWRYFGLDGSSSIFSRILRTYTGMLIAPASYSFPQMFSIRSSLVNTFPG